jgi:REP element-mobilizing transposase RayT
MSRQARVKIETGWVHVMNRGLERLEIYQEDRDREHMLELVGAMSERYGLRVHGYVLMTNHYHLLVEIRSGNLSAAVHWLNVAYSVWYNRKYGRVGPLFQGRFRSEVVEAGWTLAVLDYLHLNPIRVKGLGLGKQARKAERAGVLRPPEPEQVASWLGALREYRWSSYRAYGGYGAKPEWLESGRLLARAGKGGSDARRAYRERIEGYVRQGVMEPGWSRTKGLLAIGSAAFLEGIKRRAGPMGRELAGKRAYREQVKFETVIRKVEQEKGERWEDFRDRHGDFGRDLVLWLARWTTGMTLSQIGVQVGGLDYASAGMAIRRFEICCQREKKLFQLREKLKRDLMA